MCGGQICGAAAACRIGECHAPALGGTAQLIARSVCDPALPQPIARVTASGDYHVTIDRAASSVEYHIGDETIPSNLEGTLHFNVNGSGGIAIVDFAESRLFPDDFTIRSLIITDSTLVTSSRVLGQFVNASTFLIPADAGSFAAQGLISNTVRGQDLLNPQPITGMINLQTREVALDVVAENAEGEAADDEEGEARVVAHIVGTIDNIPPVAVSGGPTRTVECSSPLTPVTLNGLSSFDPDPGDSISHYQWFTAAGAGVGNQAVVSTVLPLGHSAFVLHVYDDDLGSASAPLDINVIDSTSPTLALSPASTCMWPPDHKRIRFRLGTDIIATSTDTCDSAPTVRIINVTSTQPDNFPGDGNTLHDATFSDHAFCIRRERTPLLGERIYWITVEARDAAGNTSTQTLPIHVTPTHKGSSCPSLGTVIPDDAPCQ